MKLFGGIFKKKEEKDKQPSVTKTSYFEKDNKGTRYETLDQASAYWIARMSNPRKDPFVLFIFNTKEEAHNALLDLSYIHLAEDSGKPICTSVLQFGYYPIDYGGITKYEAWVCGSELTHDMWQEAMEKFSKQGGKRKNDLEPERTAQTQMKAAKGDESKVVFVREDRRMGNFGVIYTYRTYKAPNKASAMAFLEKNPVTRQYYYIVVETPEGNYGRDIQGIYQEQYFVEQRQDCNQARGNLDS
jgi:hypothetical protein